MAAHDTPHKKLASRGIAQQAEAMGWQPDSRGWTYSVYDFDGNVIARRLKAYDSAAKWKYLWLDGTNAQYYHVGAGLRGAIADADGVLYIVNGEPAVLTLQAAGLLNVLSFFGESHVPATLAADLAALGVQTVRYYPDKDQSGQRAAIKLRDALQGSGITFDCRALPDDLPPKADTNDLWQLLCFDTSAFRAALDNAPLYDLPAAAPIIRQREKSRDITGLDHRDEFINTVVLPAVESAATHHKGKQFLCINPDHDDHHPSATIKPGREGNLVYFCSCGTFSLTTVARWLNLDYRAWLKDHYPNEVKPRGTAKSYVMPITLNNQYQDNGVLRVNQRYIELPQGDVIAVQSDVGTGKTTAMIGAAQTAKSALYLAPRERLAENFSRTASLAGVPIENYKDLGKADRRRPARSAFCVNSYSALADEAPGLPTPELLEVDEFEQLIDHIYGEAGTFQDREAVDAAEALKFAIHKAQRIIATDAHLGDLALDYLKAQDKPAQLVVNEYVTQRGALTIHEKRDGALAQGEALVNANEGVIVYPCASAGRAATIEARLVDMLGNSADVLLLTAENGGGERQSAFFADPNGQIGQYRAVVYSPVIGTGFDITAPVRAVIGIMAAHLSAYEARQMIGRCRNARETHVYLPMTSGTLEESAESIETAELEKAARTIKRLNAAGVRVKEDIDEAQRDYLRWHARVMARRNWSINHLREHFLSLCKGYTVAYSEAQAPELRAQLEAIQKALDEARKALVLIVDPIDADTFRRLRDAGKADEKAIAGHLRGKIESAVGVTISPLVRDQLWTEAQRRTLRHFTDLIDDVAELTSADKQEQLDGVPLPKRRHRLMRRIVVNAFLRVLINANGNRQQLDKDEFEAAIAPIVERYSADLKRLFKWRPDRCKSAAATVRHILKTIGLKLDSDQRTTGGQHVRGYQLSAASLERIHALADQRLAMLRRKRAELYDQPVNLKTAIGAVSRGDGSFKIAQSAPSSDSGATGWAAAPEHFNRQFGALTAPLGIGS